MSEIIMQPGELLGTVVSEAVYDSKWITWGRFRDHLACSSHAEALGRLFDPFTFVLIHRYLGYYVRRIKACLVSDTTTPDVEKAELLNKFIGDTFLNHLLDCFWASYVVRDVISDFFESCRRNHVDLGFGFQRFEYNKAGWLRMENERPDDEVEAKWHDAILEFVKQRRSSTG
ncbi:MAG: hypothetical protein AB1631_07755 [Acidobacteriota bacterium]